MNSDDVHKRITVNMRGNGRGGFGSLRSGMATEPTVICMSPTRELAIQIQEQTEQLCKAAPVPVRSVVVYGGASKRDQIWGLNRGAEVIVGTPGRLNDFCNMGKISLEKVKYLGTFLFGYPSNV